MTIKQIYDMNISKDGLFIKNATISVKKRRFYDYLKVYNSIINCLKKSSTIKIVKLHVKPKP